MSSRRMAGDTSAPECPSRVTYDEARACLAGSGDAATESTKQICTVRVKTRERIDAGAHGSLSTLTVRQTSSQWPSTRHCDVTARARF